MFTVIFFLSWILFSWLMSTLLGGWYIILWIVLGYGVGVLTSAIFLIIHIVVTYPLSIHSKIKNYGFRSASYMLLRFVFNVRMKVIGKENVPKKGNLVIYTNHKSYLDPLIILPNIKRPSAFAPKISLYNIPILKMVMKSIGSMPIDRNDNRKTAKAMIKAIKDIKDGFAMTVFPEGGRKDRDTDMVMETLPGAFKLALKSEANVLAITINGNSDIQHNAPFKLTTVTLVVHELINYEDIKDLHTNDVAKLVQNKLNSGVLKK